MARTKKNQGTTAKPMPDVLQGLATKATSRHYKRPATPELEIIIAEGGWTFKSPFDPQFDEAWVALMFDAFGTRSQATFRTFMNQLSSLCDTVWNDDIQGRHPVQDELVAAVQIVRSLQPRNEAEACLAAQMVAVHLMQLKLTAQALRYSHADPKSCAIAGKLARTYAAQMETFLRLRGKGSRQRITVRKYAQHEHKHIHLHQGDNENGSRPYGPKAKKAPLDQSEIGAALPSSNETGNAVPMPSNPGALALSHPRRREGIRRTER
ncbi:hypothetical protein H9L12_01020 [Sphingomonas rhizophila]|uniref:Uncharacterized protein n=1 Tax=Sphingomonas rhizophila TaxID=2071607 RepID=A0A7G9SBN8_9SPHN|nr:hypothetical protein [Sphingomonas rhizophila]QNN65263.1 hypothetical protein H9L12_01020 [Sphingomonas rhizophila]